MTRKKVKLAFITNDSSRKATFKKRKKGLMKKVSELSTLCGIDACAIVYSPYEQQPDVWPDTRGAHHVVAQFKRMPEMEQSKKMVNQESFIRNRIAKAAEQLKKLHKDNREKEMTHLMYACLTGKGVTGLAMPELNDVGWLIDRDLKEIYKRIETLKKGVRMQVPAPAPAPAKVVEKGMEMGGGQQQSWFGDWAGNIPTEIHQHGQMSGGTFAGHLGGLGGEDMISQFNDGNPHNHNNNNNVVNHNHNHGVNVLWSSAFFS